MFREQSAMARQCTAMSAGRPTVPRELVALDDGCATLDGGAGNDLLDYRIANKQVSSISVDLVRQQVTKTFFGTNITVGKAARYIRIYHNDAAGASQALSLTGLKVFAGGVDATQTLTGGIKSFSGADAGAASSPLNNASALTDADLGGDYTPVNGKSNLAYSSGSSKPYIELDLGALPAGQVIDSISLWGRADAAGQSNNLRIYLSDTKFSDLSSPATAYADLAARTGVTSIDVAAVDTSASTTFTDTLAGIENVFINGNTLDAGRQRRLGTASLASPAIDNTLAGNAQANALLGTAGKDAITGFDGDDTVNVVASTVAVVDVLPALVPTRRNSTCGMTMLKSRRAVAVEPVVAGVVKVDSALAGRDSKAAKPRLLSTMIFFMKDSSVRMGKMNFAKFLPGSAGYRRRCLAP